jgi:hypothetical protein
LDRRRIFNIGLKSCEEFKSGRKKKIDKTMAQQDQEKKKEAEDHNYGPF